MRSVSNRTSSISVTPTIGTDSCAFLEATEIENEASKLPQPQNFAMCNKIEGLAPLNLDEFLGCSSNKQENASANILVSITSGESMADMFPQWTRRAYLGSKCYRPYDLNMPIMIPGRTRNALKQDSPLTEFGKVCASIVARDLLGANFHTDRIFCSPEYRSVETAACIANKILEDQKRSVPIFIDPSLCEWRNFDEADTEKCWLSLVQLKQLGFVCEDEYTPYLLLEYLPTSETPEQYLDRLANFVKNVAQNCDGCTVMIGSSALATLMNSQKWKNGDDLYKIRVCIPTCSVALKCIPQCEHMEAAKHTKLRPFTRTLFEARQKRSQLAKK